VALFDLTFGQRLGEVKRRDCWLAWLVSELVFRGDFGGWALGFEGVLVGGEGFWLSSLNRSGFTCHFLLLLVPSFVVLAVLLPGVCWCSCAVFYLTGF